jgi:hypothetical protein
MRQQCVFTFSAFRSLFSILSGVMFVVILFLWKSNAKVISILAGLGECTINSRVSVGVNSVSS